LMNIFQLVMVSIWNFLNHNQVHEKRKPFPSQIKQNMDYKQIFIK